MTMEAQPNQTNKRRDLERLVTAKDLEALLQIDVKTLYSYVRRGLIPYVRIESNLRFRPSEVQAWLEGQAYRPRTCRTKTGTFSDPRLS